MLVAQLLGEYFDRDVYFVIRSGRKTADYYIEGKYWELKTPRGNSKRTVQHVLQKAARQSVNVVIDIGSSKMTTKIASSRVKYEWKFIPRIKRILLVSKDKKIVEL